MPQSSQILHDESTGRKIARATSTVMLALIISSLLGLIRQILIARAFGAGRELDAFNSANRVSETLFNLIAGGALASAFLPTFTTLLTQGKNSQAWKLASALANLILLITTLICLIAALFAPEIVLYALATGFSKNPATFSLTVQLLRLMLPTAVIFALSGLVMSILNSHQIFFIPALTPAMYQVGLIIGVTILKPFGVHGLAIGAIIGSVLHLGLQIPSLLRIKGKYLPILGIHIPEVKEVIRLMIPRLFGVAVVQLNFWVNTNLASRMSEGSVSALTFGFALMLIVQATLAQSMATAALPTFSSQFASGQIHEMRTTLGKTLRWQIFLSLPASIGLILLSTPLVATLYQRGSFTSQDTQYVAWALIWYAAGLVGHSLVEVLSRAFYAMHNTKTPVMVGIVVMILNIILSFLFVFLFGKLGWLPFGGLALANSLATGLEMVILLVLISKRLEGLDRKPIVNGFIQSMAGTMGMMFMLLFWLHITKSNVNFIRLIGGIILGGGVYGLLLYVINVKEIRSFVNNFYKHFKNRKNNSNYS